MEVDLGRATSEEYLISDGHFASGNLTKGNEFLHNREESFIRQRGAQTRLSQHAYTQKKTQCGHGAHNTPLVRLN